jgi:hypothetical protein
MLFPSRKPNPIALRVIGMSCLVVAILWQNAPVFSRHLSANWSHGLQGFLFGISIALNLMSVRMAARQGQGQPPCTTV